MTTTDHHPTDPDAADPAAVDLIDPGPGGLDRGSCSRRPAGRRCTPAGPGAAAC